MTGLRLVIQHSRTRRVNRTRGPLWLALAGLLGLLWGHGLATAGGQPPSLRAVDRTRIAEVFRLAEAVGDRIWPGWDEAPFALLLVSPDHEFLIRHPAPSPDFTPLGADEVLRSGVWVRKRQYSPDLLATFPAVGGIPTIVIGQAEHTSAKTSTPWVLSVLHEHFHQLQYSRPWYYAAAEGLDLARGDQTGMWMLNYPFPYANRQIGDQLAAASRALAAALHAPRDRRHGAQVAYLEARRKLRSLLASDDRRYLSFQLWQEGIARYTEYKLAEIAAAEYRPTPAFEALADYTPLDEARTALWARIQDGLRVPELDQARRTAFYAIGAAEGLLLDALRPGWKERYFDGSLSLDGVLAEPR